MAQHQPTDSPTANRARTFDIAKLDLTARVTAVCGLLAFIDSFLAWYTVSSQGVTLASANAWNVNYAWIPALVLLGLGIVVTLAGFGVGPPRGINPALVIGVGAASAIMVLIRWLTYPSGSDFGVSAGAGIGTYLALALALIVTGFGVRADAARDRVLARLFGSLTGSNRQQPPTQP